MRSLHILQPGKRRRLPEPCPWGSWKRPQQRRTCWSEWERNGCGGYQSPSAPLLEQPQDRGYFTVSKLTVQISRSGFPCDSKCKGRADNRARCCNGCVLVPGVAVAGRENRDQDVGAAEGWE